MPLSYTMCDPVRAEHRRRRGDIQVRYTCGTCGKRSKWLGPLKGMEWLFEHSPVRCVTVTVRTKGEDAPTC